MILYYHICILPFLQTQRVAGGWRDSEHECSSEITQSYTYTSYDLNQLSADTTYKIELRAHNAIGSSLPAEIRVKTARGKQQQYFSYDATLSSSVDRVYVSISLLIAIIAAALGM